MLKIPKGLKKKKKGKKSKRKGEEELFTEEDLEKYRREHQQQAEAGEGQSNKNEEWSKFKDLTTGVDSVLKKTQGDLDRIKSTSFFQRIPAGPKKVDSVGKEVNKVEKPQTSPNIQIPLVTEADFKKVPETEEEDRSEYGVTDDESEDEDEDDIFDTSYVEAVERGEVKLAYVPDSPEAAQDDSIFDTSYVETIIKGQETKVLKGKKVLDIGVAVEVLTGRIDNVTVTSKRSKRIIPGDLLFESVENVPITASKVIEEKTEQSILDVETDNVITTPIDLSVSLYTNLIKQHQDQNKSQEKDCFNTETAVTVEEEDDEFTKLAAESLESTSVTKVEEKKVVIEPVLQESWSVFEADKNENVFAESIVEDQIDVDPFFEQESDPFDTSFADQVVLQSINQTTHVLDDDDDFDPRADEIKLKINNRRKSSVHIHLTDPTGARESISGEDSNELFKPIESHDLLSGSTTDLTQLNDAPLDPTEIHDFDLNDPFDTTIVDKIIIPGKEELKFIEKELIGGAQVICRSPSDPDFNPRADEQTAKSRRHSRPENFIVNKSVVFDIGRTENNLEAESKEKNIKPSTPYYTREISISGDIDEEEEGADTFPDSLPRSQSNQDLSDIVNYQAKRRHSEYPSSSKINAFKKPIDLLESNQLHISTKVLTPSDFENKQTVHQEIDPFDTSFAGSFQPSRTELKLLAKEFSCEDNIEENAASSPLGPAEDNIFQVKALTPEPVKFSSPSEEEIDPFDTSFANNLQPGKTELKFLESELLN